MEEGDKNVEKMGSEVGGASHQEVGGILNEVREIWGCRFVEGRLAD